MQCVVEVGLAGEIEVCRFQVVSKFAEPAAVGGVDEMVDGKTPDLAVPGFIERIGPVLVDEGGSADGFGGGLPDLVGNRGLVIEAERVVEAAVSMIPAARHRRVEEFRSGIR